MRQQHQRRSKHHAWRRKPRCRAQSPSPEKMQGWPVCRVSRAEKHGRTQTNHPRPFSLSTRGLTDSKHSTQALHSSSQTQLTTLEFSDGEQDVLLTLLGTKVGLRLGLRWGSGSLTCKPAGKILSTSEMTACISSGTTAEVLHVPGSGKSTASPSLRNSSETAVAASLH